MKRIASHRLRFFSNSFWMAVLALGATAFASVSQAKTFKTQFIRFELPPNWDCKQEEIDWVCLPDNTAERSEATVVVVTKAVNEVDDNFQKYESVLKTPRDMRDLLGNAYKSQVKFVRRRQIKGQTWVDGLQVGSEIPGFYTRYVASIRERVAGLLTYSVAESVYPKYAPLLDGMVDSLEIFYDPKAFAEAMQAGPSSLLGSRGAALKGRFAPTLEGAKTGAKPAETQGMDRKQMIALLILAAVIGYVVYKRRKR